MSKMMYVDLSLDELKVVRDVLNVSGMEFEGCPQEVANENSPEGYTQGEFDSLCHSVWQKFANKIAMEDM